MQLVLASHNAGKLAELQVLLADLSVKLVGQPSLAIPEAEEPHPTFIENALAKARHAAAAADCAALADDSGVCVDALNGEPGVGSAYYARLPAQSPAGGFAECADRGALTGADRENRRRLQDAANNALMLQRLQGAADRRAHYVCTLVAVRHATDPQPLVAVGRWAGEIATAAAGAGGFGYDPLMRITELGCTVAELATDLKNRVSHRARAVADLRLQLQTVWHL